ncbi:MAG: capsular biosynthesis protein [Alphaproteobacteria bacterium]|nr:capsular biosynthesis protein [Alphaproteobacteria bacterium]
MQGDRPPVAAQRSFLFLQGLATRFFERLGAALAGRGHAVHRVNFNGGDRAFWRLPGAIDYCGRLHDWPDFLDHLLVEKGISDIILFGDCRPVHRAAIRVALARSIRVYVVEEGYLRPYWITFEEGGVNGYSSLPRDPRWYLDQAENLPPWQEAPAVPGSFRRRAAEDVLYTTRSMLGMWRFPHYSTHRPYHQLIEYAGWLRRLALQRKAERRAAAAIAELLDSKAAFFFFPLQLDDDYQVRAHSSFRAMLPAMERVVTSFARHAPADTRLVVKTHPLDSGLVDWGRLAGHIAADVGVADRLVVIDGGDLEIVVARSRAVVTVNSTVGCRALAHGVPLIALGRAIYDMPGLTYQGELDDFWNAPIPPEARLFDAFRRVLAARCLIPGSFFNEAGLKLAVDSAIERLEAVYARPARGIARSATPAPARSDGPRIAAASPSR